MPWIDTLRYAQWLTRERALRWSLGFVVLSVILATAHIVGRTAAGLTNPAGEHLGGDLINYWSGAQFANNGQAALAYNIEIFDAFQRSLIGPLAEFKMYVYPPIAMLLSWPLAKLSFIPALVAWTAIGMAFCLWSLSRLLGRSMAALATIGAPAAVLNLMTGQNGYFTAGLIGTGLMVLDRRPVLAGMLFGLLSFKPHLGALLPIALIAGGHWRAIIAAAATGVLLFAVSVALLGADAWAAFIHQSIVQRGVMEIGVWGWHRMPTVFVAMRLAGAGVTVSYGAQIVSGVLAVAIVAIVWRARCASEIKAACVVVATFLATPYAQDYDMVVLIFAAGWLLNQASADRFLPWEKITLAMLLVLPLAAMPLARWAGMQIGPIVLWAMLILLARRALALYPQFEGLAPPSNTSASSPA
jgi:arabinofuranan 3-O-arabinosyltransferase